MRDIYIVHRIDVTKSFLRGVYQVGTQLCTKYLLLYYKKALFSDLGSIRKDQTLPLLLEYEIGAKESFWDQFVAPPPLPLVAPLQHVVHINNLSVYYTEGTLNTNMYVSHF